MKCSVEGHAQCGKLRGRKAKRCIVMSEALMGRLMGEMRRSTMQVGSSVVFSDDLQLVPAGEMVEMAASEE